MKSMTRWCTVACAVIVWMIPTHAAALTVEAHGGWSRHAMGAMNDSLRSLNADIGTNLSPIDGGPSWGIGLREWASRDLLMRLEFERLSATSEDRVLRIAIGALVGSVSATWFMPTTGHFRYGLGGAFGIYRAWGEIGGLAISGHDFGGRATAEMILPIGSHSSLQGAAGYRWARIVNLNVGEFTSELTADYSGPFLRIAIATDSPPTTEATGP